MKKILSVLVAAIMIVGMFCVNVSAVELSNVVGTHGKNNTVDDGVATFESGKAEGNVVLNIETVNHRYAVDVTFPELTFAVGGVTWNVNTLSYESASGTAFENKDLSITVTNYSDLPINANGAITSSADDLATAGISLAMVDDTDSPASIEVKAVTPVSGGSGEAVVGTLKASLTSTDWIKAVNYLLEKGVQKYTVGTITVTITPVNTTTPDPDPQP